MNIEVCMTLAGSIIMIWYLLLLPYKGRFNIIFYQRLLRVALIFFVVPFQKFKDFAIDYLGFPDPRIISEGVFQYRNVKNRYVNQAFYYSETFQRNLQLIVWVIMGSLLLVSVLYKYFSLIRVLRFLRPVEEETVLQMVERIKKQIKEKRRVIVLYSGEVDEPFTTGIIRPVIILPREDMRSDRLEMVLRHELCHIKNFDLFFQFLGFLALVVNWLTGIIPLSISVFLNQEK